MNKILFFDCFSGISGDMTLGALIDLGLDIEKVKAELAKLDVPGYELIGKKIESYGIQGMDITVVLQDEASAHGASSNEIKSLHSHSFASSNKEKEYEPKYAETPVHGTSCNTYEKEHDEERSYKDIKKIIMDSDLSIITKERALSIFYHIAQAEALVHGKDIDTVHFHEVGAIDSIVDIVGVALCLEMLNVQQIYCSEVHEGKGSVACRHGVLPVPVPAVAQMLAGSDISIVVEDIDGELITPTGMGILRAFTSGSSKMPQMSVEKVGYGFGKKDTGKLNALRVVLGVEKKEINHTNLGIKSDLKNGEAHNINPNLTNGEAHNINPNPHFEQQHHANKEITVIESNIDDMTGEMLGYVMEKLFEAGALDVFFTAIQMKKNRPATKITILCDLQDMNQMVDLLFRETTTLGVRINQTERIIMERQTEIQDTEFGPIRMKTATFGTIRKSSPEYEDCAKVAKETGLPLKDIMGKI